MTTSSTGTQVLAGGLGLPPEPPPPTGSPRPQHGGPSATAVVLVLAAALVGGALTGWAVRSGGTAAHRAAGHRSGTQAAGSVIPVRAGQVSLVDATGQDDPTGVAAAVDGDPGTAWSTEWYTTSSFGNLKPGVGLLVDMGAPTTVRVVRLLLSVPGTGVQVYAGDSWAGASAPTGLSALAGGTVGPTAVFTLTRPTTARYWLVWVNQLPATTTGYRAGIAEMSFLR